MVLPPFSPQLARDPVDLWIERTAELVRHYACLCVFRNPGPDSRDFVSFAPG
jgi:hypothetical protein